MCFLVVLLRKKLGYPLDDLQLGSDEENHAGEVEVGGKFRLGQREHSGDLMVLQNRVICQLTERTDQVIIPH